MSNLIFTLLVMLHCATPSALKTTQDESYCNARFGYCIEYPKGKLTPQEEAANGDGRTFTNKKGQVILTVFGRLNLDSEGEVIPFQKQFDNDIARLQQKASITYKKAGKDFYVISGQFKNGKIFYHKMIQKEEAFCLALLEYSKEQKQDFDAYAGVVFRSFR